MKPARIQVVSLLSLLLVLLASSFLGGCGSTGGSAGGSSSVTLTIGGGSGTASTAGLAAPSAIPASVRTITITVSGPGMAEIVKTIDVAGRTTIIETLTVPKGAQRTFTITATDADGVPHFQGTRTADVFGDTLTLSIPLAVSPTNPALGRWNWRLPLPTGDSFNAVAFGDGIFAAVGENGLVLTSTDNGATWVQRFTGSLISLRSVAISGSTVIAVGDLGVVLRSTNGGITWSGSTPGQTSAFTGVTVGGGTFVAVRIDGSITASTDGGASWNDAASGNANYLSSVAWGNGEFVAVGTGIVLRSASGTGGWTDATPVEFTDTLNAITYGNGQFVAIGNGGGLVVSNDNGASWEAGFNLPSGLYGIAYVAGHFCTVGYGYIGAAYGPVSYYVDTAGGPWNDGYGGWNQATGLPATDDYRAIAGGNGRLVAAGYYGAIARAATPSAWTTVTAGRTEVPLYDVAFGDDALVVVGGRPPAMSYVPPPVAIRSLDGGSTWIGASNGYTSPMARVAFGNHTFVAVGSAGGILATADRGASWVPHFTGAESMFYDIAYGNGAFVVAGSFGTLLRGSGTGDNVWTDVAPAGSGNETFISVAFGNGTFVATQTSDNVCVSTDNGLTWRTVTVGGIGQYHTATYGNGAFLIGNSITGDFYVSTDDGSSWTAAGAVPLGSENQVLSVAYGGGLFIANIYGRSYASADRGATWTPAGVPAGFVFNGVDYGNGTFVLVGESGQILQSDPL